jgi:hypothetical protein
LYGEVEVQLQGGRLWLKLAANPAVVLDHWQDDAFVAASPEAGAPWFDWLIHFRVSEGKCRSIEMERLGWDEPLPIFHRTSR